MSRRARCQSKWNKINVFIDGQESKHFDLDELGRLKEKIKTQKRRKIQERGRTTKIDDQTKTSIPKFNYEPKSGIETFDFDDLLDPNQTEFELFQNFFDNNDDDNDYIFNEYTEYNDKNENNNFNETLFFEDINNSIENNEFIFQFSICDL